MSTKFRHRLRYTNGRYSVDEVITLLRAQREILKLGVSVLNHLDDGIIIEKTSFSVEEIKAGTLAFDIIIEIYNHYQTQVEDRLIPPLEEALSMDIPEGLEALITLLAIGGALFVSKWAYDRVRGGRRPDAPPVHIEGDYNQVIQIVSSKLNISADACDEAIRGAATPDKLREFVKSISRLAGPARRKKAEIEYGEGLILSKDTLSEMPNDLDARDMEQTVEMLHRDGIQVEIRATDLDHRKRGWGGVVLDVEGIEPKRVPVEIYPTVKVDSLVVGRVHNVDAIIEADRQPDGALIPKRIHIVRVLDNE